MSGGLLITVLTNLYQDMIKYFGRLQDLCTVCKYCNGDETVVSSSQ